MMSVLFRAFSMIEPSRRRRWLALVVLAVVVSGLEAIGALFIYLLLRVMTEPSEELALPIVGSLEGVAPHLSHTRVLLLVVASFFLVRAVFVLTQQYLQGRIAFNAGARISTQLLDRYLRMDYARFLLRDSSEMIRNTHNTAFQVVASAYLPTVTLASEALVIAGLIAVLVIQDPMATVMAVTLLVPAVGLGLRALRPQLRTLGRIQQDTGAAGIKTVRESLAALPEIRLLRSESSFVNELLHQRLANARAVYIERLLSALPSTAIEAIVVLFVVSFVWLRLAAGSSPGEEFAFIGMFAYAAMRLVPSVSRLVSAINSIQLADAAVSDISDDLLISVQAAQPSMPSEGQEYHFQTLEMRSVSFRYPETVQYALSGVSHVIRRGESIGIVGETGSGKSTLAAIIMGLLTPTSGHVLVDGAPLAARLSTWQSSIGFVPQQVALLNESILRNVALGVPTDEVDVARVVQALEVAQLMPFVDSLEAGLFTEVGDRGFRLSGGQRQRLGVARALYRDPPVVILDEGTSALDRKTEAQLATALNALRSDRTILSIAHRISTVESFDRIILMERGSVLDAGTYEELHGRRPEFRELTDG